MRFNPLTVGRQRAHLSRIRDLDEPLGKLGAEVVAWEMGDGGDGGVEMPPMDVGALEVLCRQGDLEKVDEFLGCLREANYLEALDLMADWR